ncbi:Target of rapamycin complex 2 subunit avo2 [Linderina macrospora]|uniref:Target of rapamycin complex 2 subunit avo2 n=1 Tax=Linderina macrospora TaxID=4868 RepID=A0ACC1JC07_9FUNG|nr:Target of rapamycin complex 2 subunit avo2 [Linderina macrospora]
MATMMTELKLLPAERFRKAVGENDLQTLHWLIDNNKITDIQNKSADENGWTSLMLAARLGRKEIVKYLLELGHDDEVISTDSTGNTIPMVSAKHRHEGICLLYLNRYPQTMSEINRDGNSAIIEAAQKGLNRVITFILDHGGNVNQRDIEGNTPLHHAASWNQFKTVVLLLERGAQPSLKNHKGYTAVDYAYSFKLEKHMREVIKRLQVAKQRQQQQQQSSQQQATSAIMSASPRTPGHDSILAHSSSPN